ncbi:hypothetical protein [Citrobacter portucalensis]|nr:hypothetical protein [Citrobacter portucalensis]MDV0516027.1 hypothetical protein [Citrobacter portucalensis]MDV0521334.1 hypothetical protein [Citrobacter portucalensis]MDV0566723.1 hypothetical protein [Citrobacter portucalensis]MEB0754663.1 hypothetical protein [Citrobacter portucalensis]MEB0765250.1 hypothetical protein [Citrobacter portucalensis]
MQGTISFNDVIQGLADNAFATVKAAKTALNASQDLYQGSDAQWNENSR